MSLAKALVAFQTEAPDLHFDAANPHFKNRFLSLHGLTAALRPVLVKNGLTVLQFPTQLDGQPALRTKLIHADSGDSEEDTMLLAAAKLDPQGQGSAITYARRYSLMAILGLVADEDDDGEKASAPGPRETAASPTQRKPSASAAASSGAVNPADVVIGFGKNQGTRLGDLSKQQLKWYAEKELNPQYKTDEDEALKNAAIALLLS